MTVFVDSNIPMYLVGAEHPTKDRSRATVERLIANDERLVTDAEVMQEILHRYSAIGRRDAIAPALEVLLGIVGEVVPIDADAVRSAATMLNRTSRLSARDALHVAIMRRHGVDDVLTFDTGFDSITGLRRLPSD